MTPDPAPKRGTALCGTGLEVGGGMGPAVPALEREELSKSMKFTDRIVGTRCCFGRGKRDVFGSSTVDARVPRSWIEFVAGSDI